MAAPAVRSAGTKRSVLEELHKDALADADHDLDGSARAANFKFADSYKTLRGIGSPRDNTEPAAYQLEHENTRIEQFLRLLGSGQAIYDAPAGRAFKSTFLPREPAANALVKGQPSGVLHRFRRNDTDNIPYEVRSCIVATRPTDAPVPREWHLHGVELYDFLNSNSGGEGGTPLTLTIDAVNVSFFEGLTIDARAPGAPATRTVNYVLTRAGLVDGAEKANKCVDTTDNYTVKVEKIYDTGQSTMLFPATNTGRIENETLTEMESFFSIYNICIPPVKTVSGIRSATIDFTDESIKRQLTSIKSAAEDKNPNALSKIGRQLNELIRWIIRGGAGSDISKIQYYMCIQRKRAGDWLQVLACLFPEVFGLPRDYRVKIATEDRICLLFALKMGIDVIFTSISHDDRGNTEYCLITFYKEGRVLNAAAQLANARRELLESCKNSPVGDSHPVIDYRARRDQYIELRAAKELELFRILQDIPAPAGQLDKNGAKAYIKRVLLAALRLCIFRILTPEFTRSDNEADTLQTIQAAGFVLTLANTEQYRAEIQQYRNQWFTLKRVIETKMGKHPGRPQLALADYFNDIFTVASVTANLNRKAAIIEKIDLNPRTFSEQNLNENGTGIFGYLNTGLTAAQKYVLYTALTKLAPRLQAALVQNYSKVLNLAGVILLEDTRIAVAAAPAAAPAAAVAVEAAAAAGEVVANGDRTADILNAMFDTQGFNPAQPAPAPLPRAAAAADAAAAPAVGEYNPDITGTIGTVIADFFPEQVILALRGQAALQAYIIPEDAAFLVDIRAPPQPPPPQNLEGGGKNDYILKYVHNPLTTFFLTLININHDLSCTIDHEYSLCMLSGIIYKMIEHAVKVTKGMDIFQIYDYLYSLELFLLKGVEQYFPNTGINHFMAGVLEDYYGIRGLHNYEGALKQLTRSDIKVFTHVKPLEQKNKEIMRENIVKMKTVMGFLRHIENEMALAKGSSYENSLTTNIRNAPSLNVRTTRRNRNLMKRLGNYAKTNNAKSLLRRLKEEAEAGENFERQSSMLRKPNGWNARSMVSAKGGRKTRRRRRR